MERAYYQLSDIQKTSVREIFPHGQFRPEAIFVLSGGVFEKGGRMVSSGYDDTQDEYGFLGGKERIVATARLAQVYPEAKIVTLSSGKPLNRPESTEISYADVHAQELINLGVEPSRIIKDGRSKNTVNEMLLVIDNSGQNNFKDITIISGGFQYERAVTMWRNLDKLLKDDDLPERINEFKRKTNVGIVSSTAILSRAHATFNDDFIRQTESRPQYATRVKNEQQGIADIESGKYRPKVGVDLK